MTRRRESRPVERVVSLGAPVGAAANTSSVARPAADAFRPRRRARVRPSRNVRRRRAGATRIRRGRRREVGDGDGVAGGDSRREDFVAGAERRFARGGGGGGGGASRREKHPVELAIRGALVVARSPLASPSSRRPRPSRRLGTTGENGPPSAAISRRAPRPSPRRRRPRRRPRSRRRPRISPPKPPHRSRRSIRSLRLLATRSIPPRRRRLPRRFLL